MYRRVCALLTAFLFLVPAAGCAKTEKPGGSSNPASGTPSSEIAMTGEATSTTAASGTTETNTTATTDRGGKPVTPKTTKTESTGSWDRNDANKVTKTNGFTYEGIKPNSKKVTLPKSSSQYTGEIVLVENMEKYVPDGDNGYDTGFLLLALQGLANRDHPSLFIQRNGFTPNGNNSTKAEGWLTNINEDLFWLSYLTAPGQYLEKAKIQTWSAPTAQALCQELLEKFKGCYSGLVVWDPNVYSTSLVAATVAGADNLLPVRYSTAPSSMYVFLTKTMKLPVKVDLNGKFTGKAGAKIWGTSLESTGSAKNDAYLWAKVNYLDKNKTSASYMGHFPDAAPRSKEAQAADFPIYWRTISYSADFLISQKAFMFDLCAFPALKPYDDPDQKLGTDYDTFNQILSSQYKRAGGNIFHVEGWPTWKTEFAPGNSFTPTEAEFQYIKLLSQYNGRGECDAKALNTSLFQHVPEGTYKQTASKTVDTSKYDPDKKYVLFYCGDYDSTHWLEYFLPFLWENDARGSLPLAWGINGSQSASCRVFFNYMYQTATENDWFVSGNNGGAYLNPICLQPEKKDAKYARKLVPDGLEQYKSYCLSLNKKYDLDASPRLIMTDGMWNSTLLKAYADIAPAGFGYWEHTPSDPRVVSAPDGTQVPYVRYYEGVTNMNSTQEVYDFLKTKLTPSVSDIGKGMVICPATIVSPGVLEKVVDDLHANGFDFEVVGPYEFFAYARMRA